MSVFQSQQPIVIPDPTDPVYGPSGFNVPIVSVAPGSPVGNTIANNSTAKYYTVAANLFPQPSGGTNTYRFTINAYLDTSGVIDGTPTGNVALIVGRRTSAGGFQPMGGNTVRLISGVGSGTQTYFGTVSCVFMPSTGDTLEVLLGNYTGGSLVITLVPTQGSGIELVSRQTTQQLIFS
jgi:hypothetical protein